MRKLLAAVAAVMSVYIAGHADTDRHGCLVRRTDTDAISLVFAADSAFDGGDTILAALANAGVKGSFFFTGNFLRLRHGVAAARRCIEQGHYVGPHSDGHILLAQWDGDRTPLVSADSAIADIRRNMRTLAYIGVDTAAARYVLPPYEWCAAIHSQAYATQGLTTINITPGTGTYRDYTTPGMAEYASSQLMETQLIETARSGALKGAIIIVHPGTDTLRTDKFYNRLPAIIDSLTRCGYRFDRF